MATRLYFPSTTAAEVTPVANGAWGNTAQSVDRKLVRTTKSNTAMAQGTQVNWTVGTTCRDRRYVSTPLDGTQTISGTVKCYLMTREYNNGDNSTSRFELYVVTRDGATVRGTLLPIGQYGPATEYANVATHRNKAFADGDTVTNVNCQDGDRIVVVIGHTDAAGSTPEASVRYGDPTSGTDLAENETGTTDNPGWIEFSATLVFETGTTYSGDASLTGTSGFTSAATRSTAGATTISGANGTVTVAGTRSTTGATTIAGANGTVTANGTKSLFGAVIQTGGGTVTASASVTVQGVATMAGGGAMTVEARETYKVAATISGSNGTLTADGIKTSPFAAGCVITSGPSVVASAAVVKNVHNSHRGGSTSATDGT